MEVFSSGVLIAFPQYPQRILRLDDGGIQQGYSTMLTPNHYIRSSNLATLYRYEADK